MCLVAPTVVWLCTWAPGTGTSPSSSPSIPTGGRGPCMPPLVLTSCRSGRRLVPSLGPTSEGMRPNRRGVEMMIEKRLELRTSASMRTSKSGAPFILSISSVALVKFQDSAWKGRPTWNCFIFVSSSWTATRKKYFFLGGTSYRPTGIFFFIYTAIIQNLAARYLISNLTSFTIMHLHLSYYS